MFDSNFTERHKYKFGLRILETYIISQIKQNEGNKNLAIYSSLWQLSTYTFSPFKHGNFHYGNWDIMSHCLYVCYIMQEIVSLDRVDRRIITNNEVISIQLMNQFMNLI